MLRQPRALNYCAVCQNLNPTRQEEIAITQVNTSADLGCMGCTVLATVLAPYWKGYSLTDEFRWSFSNLERTVSIELFQPSRSNQESSKKVPFGSLWAENAHVTSLELWTLTGVDQTAPECATLQQLTSSANTCPWNSLKPTASISMDTGSTEALDNLTSWIQDCKDTHGPCNHLSKSSQLPTRVIEILGPGKIRLWETSGEEGSYTCLSYCWGSTEFIKTTRTTLSKHLKNIPWHHLPKTFQDAIDLTSRLGIKYIWIDSLCILQVRPILI
jgi:hypothetical protein